MSNREEMSTARSAVHEELCVFLRYPTDMFLEAALISNEGTGHETVFATKNTDKNTESWPIASSHIILAICPFRRGFISSCICFSKERPFNSHKNQRQKHILTHDIVTHQISLRKCPGHFWPVQDSAYCMPSSKNKYVHFPALNSSHRSVNDHSVAACCPGRCTGFSCACRRGLGEVWWTWRTAAEGNETATWEERTGGRARQRCGGSRQKDVVTFGRCCQEKVKHFQRRNQPHSSQRETATPDEFYEAAFLALLGLRQITVFSSRCFLCKLLVLGCRVHSVHRQVLFLRPWLLCRQKKSRIRGVTENSTQLINAS